MSLSLQNPISSDDIRTVSDLKEGKVFLITGPGRSEGDTAKIVLKGEYLGGTGALKAKFGATVARQIDRQATAKTLTPAERTAVETFCSDHEEVCQYYAGAGINTPAYSGKHREAVQALASGIKNPGNVWVKMEAVSLNGLDKAILARAEGDKTALRSFADTLRAPQGLEKLGRIIAADAFNGNFDRICPDAWDTPEGHEFEFGKAAEGGNKGTAFIFKMNLKTFRNLGNITVVATDPSAQRFEASMLDYLDPFTYLGDIHAPIKDGEDTMMQRYVLRTLADKNLRKKYAKDVIEDFEKILNPRKSRFSLRTKLGSSAVSRLELGMIEGCRLIKEKFEAKFPVPRSVGLTERLNLLAEVR
ncbi:hypothetical protein [uncultured Xylophilus sp.]|uniref:hypothetical protein n=1 Tax=uncultured Xylophilus sp. TaxID=296832 RepID=UPI0025E9320D|nr:hypothetical protein [uncultured Xylophilus sp.]